MPEYLVKWEIELNADTPLDAAEKAFAIQRDPTNTAAVFQVQCSDLDPQDCWDEIDLTPDS